MDNLTDPTGDVDGARAALIVLMDELVRILKVVCLVGLLPFLLGCVGFASIESNGASSASVSATRIFVVMDMGEEFGKDYLEGFQAKFEAALKSCNVASQFSVVAPLELDGSGRIAAIRDFMPDAVLSIGKNGGTYVRWQGQQMRRYSLNLVEVRSGKAVWKADGVVTRGPQALPQAGTGALAARVFADKMKTDRVLGTC